MSKLVLNKSKDNSFYKLVSCVGRFVRTTLLFQFIDNPINVFASLITSNLVVPSWLCKIISCIIVAFAELLHFDRLLHRLSFATVGVQYTENTNKAFGSFWYSIFYVSYSVMLVFLLTHFCLPAIIFTLLFYCILVYLMAFSTIINGTSKNDNTGKLLFQALITLLVTAILVMFWWILQSSHVISL